MMLSRHAITDSTTAANPRPLSVNSAIKLLTSTMRDPMKAIVCSTRMSIAADCIDQALDACDSTSAKTKLAKSRPELLRAGIKFLTFKQSPQDFATMMNRLVQCRCDFGQKGMRGLHTPSRCRKDGLLEASGTDLVFDAVAIVIRCIILALSELAQHKFRTGNSSDDEQPWPQGPKDLLPFGPKDSVDGLGLWVARPPNGYPIFKLAGFLATFYAPFRADVFQYLDYTFPLYRTFQHLDAAITFYYEGDSSPLAREYFFASPIITIFQFFDNLAAVDLNHLKKMVFLRGDWLKPYLAHLKTLSTLPPEYQWIWTKICPLVSYINSFANAKRDPKTGQTVAELDFSLFSEVAKQVDPLENSFDTIRMTRKMGCCNIQCLSQYGVNYPRLCGRCSLIRYCGEKCQKEAWKYASLPHKGLCAKIYSLKEAFGCSDWSFLWKTDFAQFQVLCSSKNVDTELVVEIGDTITTLRAYKFGEETERALAEESRESLTMQESSVHHEPKN